MCACECVCLKPNRDGSHWAGRKQVNLIMCVSERTPPLKNRCSFVDLKTVMISNYQIITVGISVKSVNWHVCPSSKLPSNAEKWLMNGFFFFSKHRGLCRNQTPTLSSWQQCCLKVPNLYLLSKQNAFNLVHVLLCMWAIASHFMVIACPLYGDSAHHMA